MSKMYCQIYAETKPIDIQNATENLWIGRCINFLMQLQE